METIYLNRENLRAWQEKAKPCVCALGCFDGLHIGHCKVINTAYEKAKEKNVQLAVMSFFPHPKTVITNGKKQVHYLMPLSEKEERLQSLGVDTFYIVEFDKEFAALPPEQFVAKYLIQLGVVHAVAGFDFCYGCRGSGNMDRLNRDSEGRINITNLGKVGYHGEKISSTSIRERLLTGNVEELPHFLGHYYEVKCDWDGEILKPHPYYTLPAPGRYAVTVKNETCAKDTEVIVIQTQVGPSLKCTTEIPPNLKGRLSIVWYRHIVEDNVQHYNEKILIS
ncbi:FAD synthetase family protein [Bacillus sp. EB600]|uniref:FAD synthetase family protein n=1 Tax=Bacillus sp. EB600 TaxID=2806345 RepID=UPI00210E4A27|nr:FAD synthetase family protein [Bacillus sp. EB600]MCQ6281591.1 FAD synthetase family protein [Bacillus sp. EB600]